MPSDAYFCYYLTKVKYRGKQCGPISDCSYSSSLIWVYTVQKASKTFQRMTKADKFLRVKRTISLASYFKYLQYIFNMIRNKETNSGIIYLIREEHDDGDSNSSRV